MSEPSERVARWMRKPLLPAWTLVAAGLVLLMAGALMLRPQPHRLGDGLIVAGVYLVGVWSGRRQR